MYYDLNICVAPSARKKTLETLNRLGYNVIAFNTIISDQNKITKENIPERTQLNCSTGYSTFHTDAQKRQKQLQVLERVTLVIKEVSQLVLLSSPELNHFDLVAVVPESEKLLQQCLQFDFDIISLPLDRRLYYHLKRPQIHVAAEKGMLFEVCYSPILNDTQARKAIIGNTTAIARATSGKYMLFSSGAKHEMDLRGPHDVANLAILFDTPQEHAKDAISKNGEHIVTHGHIRSKSHRGMIVIKEEPKL